MSNLTIFLILNSILLMYFMILLTNSKEKNRKLQTELDHTQDLLSDQTREYTRAVGEWNEDKAAVDNVIAELLQEATGEKAIGILMCRQKIKSIRTERLRKSLNIS